MDEAKQSFCVIAGGKEYIRDSILAAMLAKNQIFPSLNLLVVPVEMEVTEDGRGPKGLAKGFGNSSLSYEQEGYVAAPVDVSVRGLVPFCVRTLGAVRLAALYLLALCNLRSRSSFSDDVYLQVSQRDLWSCCLCTIPRIERRSLHC